MAKNWSVYSRCRDGLDWDIIHCKVVAWPIEHLEKGEGGTSDPIWQQVFSDNFFTSKKEMLISWLKFAKGEYECLGFVNCRKTKQLINIEYNNSNKL